MTARQFAWLGLLAATLAAGPAPAQVKAKPVARGAAGPGSLLDRVGIARLEQTLRGGGSQERERALSRLGALGSPRALELLVRSLDPSGAAQSPRERLLVVRTLALHVREPAVRECLVRVMTGISTSAERGEPLQSLLRDTAALALSASGDPPAFEALGKALRQSGRVAQAAAAAIAAHPPFELSALVRAHYAPTVDLVNALEALGDQRAFELLRDIVRRGAPELRARAALALTRLGNFETVELAHSWAEAPSQPVLRLAAAEILLLSRDGRAAALLTSLLAGETTRAAAIELLQSGGNDALEAPLLAAFAERDPDETPSLLTALGRNGGRLALAELARLTCDARFGDAAAYALATSPGAAASPTLAQQVRDPSCRRRAARAAALRASALGERPGALLRGLDELLASSDAKDRAVGAFGLSLLRPTRASELLAAKDAVIVQAAARAAPFVGLALPAARRLELEPPGPTRTQLALALVDPEARASVPTRVLLELVSEGGAATPLALFALAERDGPEIRTRLLDFLGSPDPSLRANVAGGLGESRDPSALGVLENVYRFEADGDVRARLVQAMARRPEGARLRLLELAARLDPDPAARQAARLGLSGVRAATIAPGHATLWLTVAGETALVIPAATVDLPGGLGVPALADPDGVVSLARLPAGNVASRLTIEPRQRQSPTAH